jgi:hypothetical protein
LVAFDEKFETLLEDSYRWDLWAAAYIINGGCSDDCFDYFRNWLISLGQEAYDAVIDDPKVLSQYLDQCPPYYCRFEGLSSAAGKVYRARYGEEIPTNKAPF